MRLPRLRRRGASPEGGQPGDQPTSTLGGPTAAEPSGDGPAPAAPPAEPAPAEPAPGEPAPGEPAEVALATRAETRLLRRLLIVAFAWAVAASVLGALALFSEEILGEEPPASERTVSELSERVEVLEAQTESIERNQARQNRELSSVSGRVDELEADVRQATDDASAAARTSDRLSGRIDDLEQRLEELESSNGGGGGFGN